jgi:hypothetical protein
MRVKRGLLSTKLATLPKPQPAAVRADALMAKLRLSAPGSYEWREAWELFKSLSNHNPDMWGRRIFSPAAIEKAQYAARVCHRAHLRGVLPSGRAWAYLSGAVRLVFHELEQSGVR